VRVQARRRGGQTYYYLVNTYREGRRVRKLEQYLGRRIPRDIEARKSTLRLKLLIRQWSPVLARIRQGYRINQRKMPGSAQEKELETFATRFTYDSNKIEGSSLTLRETALLLSDGVTPSNRPLADVREALAHQRVFLGALREDTRLDRETLLRWHEAMFRETKPLIAGKIREFRIGISGSAYEPPLPVELDNLLTEFFSWLRVAWRTTHPVVLAALVHLRLVSIHPFGDGNGRVTRLAMNFVLHKKGYPMLDIPYSQRSGYYRALERTHLTGDEGVFIRWFLRRYLEENSWTMKGA
jgi:Fic family protein